jgi:hypothetical protein
MLILRQTHFSGYDRKAEKSVPGQQEAIFNLFPEMRNRDRFLGPKRLLIHLFELWDYLRSFFLPALSQ